MHFLMPNAMYYPDCLHMLFGQLQFAVESFDWWPELRKHLRSLANFLGSKALRQRFQQTCLVGSSPAIVALFDRFSPGGKFDFKWQYFSRFAAASSNLLPVMLDRFNKTAMLTGRSSADDCDVTRIFATVISQVCCGDGLPPLMGVRPGVSFEEPPPPPSHPPRRLASPQSAKRTHRRPGIVSGMSCLTMEHRASTAQGMWPITEDGAGLR